MTLDTAPVRVFCWGPSESVWRRAVDEVARTADADPLDLPPLAGTVDTDPLDGLLPLPSRTDRSRDRLDVHLPFGGYRVHLSSDGRGCLSAPRDGPSRVTDPTTVRCVDNDPLVRDYLEVLLRSTLAVDTVRTAVSASDALSWLDDDGREAVDCVVFEYHLYTGGVRFLRALRARSATVPAVVFTTGLPAADERAVHRAGTTAVVEKCPRSRCLTDLVSRVLDAARTDRD